MAQLPAAVETTRPEEGDRPTPFRLPRNALVAGLSNLDLWRQLGLMLGLAASVAVGVGVVLWAQEEDYRPLYSSLDRLDSTEVLEVLDSAGIGYRMDRRSGALLVPADRIHDARLRLAEISDPNSRTQGFELLDQEQPLGTSQFMEDARYRRSLEGELARTIASLHSVRSARVHLAMPRQSVFLRDRREPSASVLVELFPGRRIEPEQVRSITNLVASSIPELRAESVTVVDQRGSLLSRLALEDPELIQANRQLQHAQRLEERTVRRIHAILEPVLGPGRFHAEVAVDVDFTASEEAQERYRPDPEAVRSESRSEEVRGNQDLVVGIPGALSNQPPAEAAAPEQAGEESDPGGTRRQGESRRQQSVRNYELDRTISYTRHDVGRIARLTVAVAVDDRLVPEGGEPSPWTADELAQLTLLVQDAVGFDASRGDSVNLVQTRFFQGGQEFPTLEEEPWYRSEWVPSALRWLLAIIALGVLVLGVLRPVMRSLSQPLREDAGLEGLPAPTEELPRELLAEQAAGLSEAGGMLLPPPESYEQQIDYIKGLIADDPGRVAQVVKQWVASSE